MNDLLTIKEITEKLQLIDVAIDVREHKTREGVMWSGEISEYDEESGWNGVVRNEEWGRNNFGGGLGDNGMDLTLNQFMDRGIPAEMWLGYFAELPYAIVVGDWMILHAGVNPDRDFDQQRAHEVIWIRDEFMFGITPPESRMGKRLVVGHNETFWLGSVGKPVSRKITECVVKLRTNHREVQCCMKLRTNV